MAHKRNYAKEYAARTGRAKALGFTGYGQERKARVEYRRDFERAIEKGWVDKTQRPKPGSENYKFIMELRAKVISKSRKWEPGKPKLSPDEKAQLARLYPDVKERGAIYGLLYD